jgi:ligand-binding sensor domain-containing protein/DNA-binding CsgD family transcriptional regulator
MPLWLGGQNLLPPIRNYKIFDYNAASKNWGLAINEKGELFAANNKGLLHFNGEDWNLYELPSKTVIRSVAYIKGKVYTGSYEEFGCWEKDDTGLMRYTSLTHLIKDHAFTSEEFWQILPYKNSIVFRSFSGVYRYQNNRITVIDSDIIAAHISVYDGKLLVAGDQGFFEVRDRDLVRVKDLDILDGMTIIDMVETKDGLLIGTKLNGCYLFKNGGFVPWEENVNLELKSYQLNNILPLGVEKMAFGTIKNGIYIYNTETNESRHLNRETGLQNNTVLALMRYKNQLWAGLDNGISRIRLETPITYYTDYSGSLGTVYDLALFKNVLYLGSNTGIYYFEDDRLGFIEGSQGHVWDLEVVEGNLLSGHNTGTYRIADGSLEKISDITGGYQFAKVPEERATYLQGTYIGISKYQKDLNGRWDVKRVAGIDFPVKQLCFENRNTVWAAHPYKGLYRLTIDGNYDRIMEKQEFTADDIPNNYNVKLHKVKNQILIQSGGVWHKYDPILGKITVLGDFGPYNDMKLVSHDEGNFWFVDTEQDNELIYTDLKGDSLAISEPLLEERLVPDTENMVKANDSSYFFTLVDGFARINLNALRQRLLKNDIPVPELNFFRDEKKRYALTESVFEIPYKNAQDIAIQVAAPELERPKFHYTLEGAENRSAYVPDGNLNFQNLPQGSYELSVATVGIDNKTSAPRKITFDIAPPWYLSPWSMVLYALALIGTVFLVRGYNRRKLKRKQYALEKRLHREQEERLATLEREKLEREIKQKQKELARTTLNVAKKNELILELKDMLALNKEALSNKQRYRSLTKKLDTAINGEEDWKHFEVNFKELHGDFFDNLLHRFPKLTPKDLKLCAYLKMNLSTKEIAPLMGITVRGVEIHRYRLRKKLDMDSAQNLNKFLIRFD